MKPYHLIGTNEIPSITLDKDQSLFEITGDFLSENIAEYFEVIFKWLDEYLKDPNSQTIIKIKVNYFNTTASKFIYMMLQRLEFFYQQGIDIRINWHVRNDDVDLLEIGEEYKSLLTLPFNFIFYY